MLSTNPSRCPCIPSNKVLVHLNCAGNTVQSPCCRCTLHPHVQHQNDVYNVAWASKGTCRDLQGLSNEPNAHNSLKSSAHSRLPQQPAVVSTTTRICKVVGGMHSSLRQLCASKPKLAPQQPSPCEHRRKLRKSPATRLCRRLFARRLEGISEKTRIPKPPR